MTPSNHELNNNASGKAFMIRKDGKVFDNFPYDIHPYIMYYVRWNTIEVVCRLLYDCPLMLNFFYDNSGNDLVREKVLEVAQLFDFVHRHADEFNFDIDTELTELLTDMGYPQEWRKLVPEGSTEKLFRINQIDDNVIRATLIAANTVCNNNFLRIRLGGKYRSSNDLSVMYARISSKNVNWFDNLWRFVYDRGCIQTINVIYDEQSMDMGDEEFEENSVRLDGVLKLNNVSRDEFLGYPGNPYLEKLKREYRQKKLLENHKRNTCR